MILDLHNQARFMAVWDALSQYVENTEEAIAIEREERNVSKEEAKLEAARDMMEQLDAKVAALCSRVDCPVCGGPE